MNQELSSLIYELISINEEKYKLLKQNANYIFKNNIKDEHIIESLLDGLLDILYTSADKKTATLYMKACLYYYEINADYAEEYYQFYLETLGEDYQKTKNK